LLICDLGALTFCATKLLETGPSSHILFGFEAAILLASVLSVQALYNLHVLDGVVTLMQRIVLDKGDSNDDTDSVQENTNAENTGEEENPLGTPLVANEKKSVFRRTIQQMSFFWRDHRATATFGIELMAVAAKFLFNLLLFIVVFTIYGLPINIVRDLYIAYQKLRNRLSSFASYRRLTSNMNTRFESITTEEELEQAGRTCIICRDVMDIHGINGDCKKLPICGHGFHKHCLREWLGQQQTCPTCRADIQVNESRARAEERRRREENDNSEERNDTVISEDTDNGAAVCIPVRNNTDVAESNVTEPNQDTVCGTDIKMKGNSGVTEVKKKVHSNLIFPCLYEVVAPSGTPVVHFENRIDIVEDSGEKKKIERVVKAEALIVCTERKWYKGEGSYLKIPNGWVKESDVKRILPLVP